MHSFTKLKRNRRLAGLLVIDGIVFGVTNTGSAPAHILILGFVALVATFYYLFYGLLGFASLYGLAFKRKRRLAGYLTLWTGFLVALQSIGELNTRDVLVLLPLVAIGYAYSLYGKSAGRLPDM
jgi:hypothetical protein